MNIYEVHNSGAVVSVKGKNPNNDWFVLWEASQPEKIKNSRIFSPPISVSFQSCFIVCRKLSVINYVCV